MLVKGFFLDLEITKRIVKQMSTLEDSKKIRKAFGKRVRLLRKTRGITQVQLAKKAGIHSTFLSRIERGITSASLESIIAIAKALQTHPGKLFPTSELDEKVERLITWFQKNRKINLEEIIGELK